MTQQCVLAAQKANCTEGWWLQAERGQVYIRYKEEILCCEGGEALEHVAQRNCEYPFPGSVQGQVGWGFEQSDLMEGVPAHGRGVGPRWSLMSIPTQSILCF